ncbi:hypothetical protein AV656_08400 [Bhargavaea cecembensis]|uniref:Uncharacterized protein n=1 Tax=Bhargavaea cecembensis TaxID=394098 RepID=A0A163FLR3_9BACL|nr:hypothetical protein [Bhargavaea cecembensis]KZE38911.1 hypothetical protein AV656_08400 [Bhargavaea cecembensis]
MKPDFTPEELYQAYAPEVYSYMVKTLGRSPEEARRILRVTRFQQKFTSNTSDYDFATPGEVAEELIRSLKPKTTGKHNFRSVTGNHQNRRVIIGPKGTAIKIARASHPNAHRAESSSHYSK